MAFQTLFWDDVAEGDAIPTLTKEVNATTIVAGAVASRDFQPVHHDGDFARSQGNQDLFMNIMTTYGWMSRFLTDWTGPCGRLKNVSIRLRQSCYPGDTLVWNGKVLKKYAKDGQHLVDVEYEATVPRGVHCSGSGTLALPTRG